MKPGELHLQASILDRLVDDEPKVSHEPVQSRSPSIGQIKASLVRDLENLLNARRHILSPPAGYKEVNNSLFVYGLRDFTGQSSKSVSVRQQLRQDVEKTVARFEPRLKNVIVHLEAPIEKAQYLRFRISGTLTVDPLVEPVTFDTYLDVNKGQYVISK